MDFMTGCICLQGIQRTEPSSTNVTNGVRPTGAGEVFRDDIVWFWATAEVAETSTRRMREYLTCNVIFMVAIRMTERRS
jgi:hypothetical protein